MKSAIAVAMTTALLTALPGCSPNPADRAPVVYTQWPFDAAEAKKRQKETAKKLGVQVEKAVDLGNGVKLELVLIPAGEFMMGGDESPEEVAKNHDSDPAWHKREHPQHLVRISKPFFIGKYEATQEVWQKVMGANPSHYKGARNPVEMVSWDDCQGFFQKLNGLGTERGVFRMPTEAEWEYVCRAGTMTPFHFGRTISKEQANVAQTEKTSMRTTTVGSFPANAWGIHDMHGNVHEWCADWSDKDKDYYADSPKDDPPGLASGSWRMHRGGSFAYRLSMCRSAYREAVIPTHRGPDIGLRVVLAVGGI